MRFCKACNSNLPHLVMIDGIQKNISGRKYCLSCSPFGKHNTRDPRNRPSMRPVSRLIICITCQRSVRQKGRNKECHTCRAKQRRTQNKERAIALLGGKCSICGYSKFHQALDFHHENKSEKRFSLSYNWHRKWIDLQAEVNKCILLCCRCHAEIHAVKV